MRFNLLGVKIRVSFLFTAVIAFMLITDRTGLAFPTLIAAFLHESGHLLAMWAMDCRPREIHLIPAAIKIIRGYPNKKYGELAIALCGPAANFACYLTLRLWYFGCGGAALLHFAIINLLLGGFNMLPVTGLDGGTVLRLLLENRFGAGKAWHTVKIISFFSGIAVLSAALIITICGSFNLTVYITALYLILTALLRT